MASPAAERGLARFINIPGGMSAEEAVSRADANIVFYREPAFAAIDEALRELCTECRREAALMRASHIAERACAIVNFAGPFKLEAIGAAAASLAKLAHEIAQRGAVSPLAVHAIQLHVQALHALRIAAAPDPARDELLIDGLVKISARALTRS